MSSLVDLLHLGLHDGAVAVTVRVQARNGLEALLPSVLAGKPSGRLGEEEQRGEEHGSRDGLHAPGDAERRGTRDAG